jgi:crotonobetainyl-CoA:carnitine CoA-transferase CaiB-like acyl-CoA transferase
VFVRIPDEDFGEITMQNVIARLSETPGSVAYGGRGLGADTDAILAGELGIDEERLSDLRKRGIVA